LGEDESSGVGFLEGDQAGGELEQGEVVLVFLRPADQIARLRLSHEWQASTIQRRARQPGVRALSVISSPRVRMCGVSPYSPTSSRESALS
jgi:hypothetical protein